MKVGISVILVLAGRRSRSIPRAAGRRASASAGTEAAVGLMGELMYARKSVAGRRDLEDTKLDYLEIPPASPASTSGQQSQRASSSMACAGPVFDINLKAEPGRRRCERQLREVSISESSPVAGLEITRLPARRPLQLGPQNVLKSRRRPVQRAEEPVVRPALRHPLQLDCYADASRRVQPLRLRTPVRYDSSFPPRAGSASFS